MTNTPSLLPVQQFLLWAGVYSYFFWLFWLYLPFALAAQELTALLKGYA